MTDDMFEPRPSGWGLRGDPLLWDALEASLETLEPGDITDIEAHLRSLYTKLVGTPLTEDDTPVTVERFKMGGMSSRAHGSEDNVNGKVVLRAISSKH